MTSQLDASEQVSFETRQTWQQKARFLAIAGVGFFADGYLNITIGLVVPMIGYTYFADTKNTLPTNQSDSIKGALSIGMIFGQVLFGFFGDAIGRRKIYGKELIITIFGTFMVIVAPGSMSHTGIVAWLVMFRIVTGVGIGADYPMSSSLGAEKPAIGRSKTVLLIFASYGLGSFTASIVFLILVVAFKGAINRDVHHIQWVWRLLLGIGIIPAAVTLYGRLTMRETEPYKKYVSADSETSLTDKSKRGPSEQWHDFIVYFSEWRHLRTLLATSTVWFLFDVAFYGINLNQTVVLTDIGFGSGATPYITLHNLAIGNIIVSAAGSLPGAYAAIPLPDIIGRVRLQFFSLIIVAILYAIWAGVTEHTTTGGLITLFALSQFFLNIGPSSTTFLIPVEVFPTRVRATAHGISAASGKAGAVLTSFAFGIASEALGLPGVLGLFAGALTIGAIVTLVIPETKGMTLEAIEADDIYRKKVGREGERRAEDNSDKGNAEETEDMEKRSEEKLAEVVT